MFVTSCLSPFKKLYDSIPDYSSLKVFSSTCFVLHPQLEHSKFSSRSAICVFLHHEDGQKDCRHYNHQERKYYVSSHVVFLEHIIFYSVSSSYHLTRSSGLTLIHPFSLDDDVSSYYNFENRMIDAITTYDIVTSFVSHGYPTNSHVCWSYYSSSLS